MNWPDYFMGFAVHAASKSKDSTKVGAIVVGPNKDIRAVGYNGPPRGVQDLPERFERPAKYNWCLHAEINCIAHAARIGIPLLGCTLYCTHSPCSGCARAIIQVGIRAVVVGSGETHMPVEEFDVARILFYEADVSVSKLETT